MRFGESVSNQFLIVVKKHTIDIVELFLEPIRKVETTKNTESAEIFEHISVFSVASVVHSEI
ncbi:MAG: hypothetical protein WA130_20825 [Candidatus Methanoperedens sp.]